MKQAVIAYPDSLPDSLELEDRAVAGELAFLAAAKLFELGKLTVSQAAALADLARLDFLSELGRVGVPAINLREEEVALEVGAARELAR